MPTRNGVHGRHQGHDDHDDGKSKSGSGAGYVDNQSVVSVVFFVLVVLPVFLGHLDRSTGADCGPDAALK